MSDGVRLRCLKSVLDVLVELSAIYLKGNAQELIESVKFGAIRKQDVRGRFLMCAVEWWEIFKGGTYWEATETWSSS